MRKGRKARRKRISFGQEVLYQARGSVSSGELEGVEEPRRIDGRIFRRRAHDQEIIRHRQGKTGQGGDVEAWIMIQHCLWGLVPSMS